MRTKRHRPIAVGESETVRQLEARREIDTFLRALNSYPERFAREQDLSFEQHLSSITTGSQGHHTSNDPHRNR
jgi:hypothetical protein